VFLYKSPQIGQKEEVPIRVISGPSPYRQYVLNTGLLDPGDIGEYASDFPMEKISYEPFDFEGRYCNRSGKPSEPMALAKQAQLLPEQVQNDTRFCIKNGIVTVAIPLPNNEICHVGCDENPPHTIRAVYVKGRDTKGVEDVSIEVLAGRHNITLNQVYEILSKRQFENEGGKNVD
jgi:hypothetical protein